MNYSHAYANSAALKAATKSAEEQGFVVPPVPHFELLDSAQMGLVGIDLVEGYGAEQLELRLGQCP